MTFQAIRAHIETKVNTAFQNLSPPIEVMFDNVQETPPALPYVVCLISYLDTTMPTVCVTDGAVEQINGNLQLSIYVPRGRGMKALEQYSATAMTVMNTLFDWGSSVKVKAGQINGPVPLLNGDEPYALATISCPFLAKSFHCYGPPSGINWGSHKCTFTDDIASQTQGHPSTQRWRHVHARAINPNRNGVHPNDSICRLALVIRGV